MPRERLNGIEIPSLDDDVFESDDKKALDQAEKVIEIKLNKIVDFPNHPFQVREDEEIDQEKCIKCGRCMDVLSVETVYLCLRLFAQQKMANIK